MNPPFPNSEVGDAVSSPNSDLKEIVHAIVLHHREDFSEFAKAITSSLGR